MHNKKLIFIFLVAFIFRFLLIPIAHHGDLNNNISWGDELLRRGMNGFYEGSNWPYSAPNQPPLYLFLFGLTSFLYQIINNLVLFLNNTISVFPSTFVWFWENRGLDILVKLPSILADLAIGLTIYKFLVQRKKTKIATISLLVWLFNPVSWYNSAIWGQTDAIVNLLGLLAVVSLLNKKLLVSSLFLVLSFLFKPSLLVFLPVWFFVALLQKHTLTIWFKVILFSSLIILGISFFFHPALDLPIWLFRLYKDRFISGEIGDLQANAFNFWYLVDSRKILDSTLFLGVPARMLGLLLTLFGYLFILFKLYKKHSEKNILFAFCLSALLTFLFMTRIHERYIYPFFPLATILLAFIDWFWVPYLLLSLLSLLNLYHLFYTPSIPVVITLYQNPTFPAMLATANILVFLYLLGTYLSPHSLDK